jgi:hypothetical protein
MMMLRLAEGLGLPLGPAGFADYGRAVEVARYQGKPIKVKDFVAEVVVSQFDRPHELSSCYSRTATLGYLPAGTPRCRSIFLF